MQRSLAMAALVVLIAGLGTVGYLQVAGEAGEAPPGGTSAAPTAAPEAPPTRSPGPRPEPIPAPTRAPRPDPSPSPSSSPSASPSPADVRPPTSEPVPVEPPAGEAYTEDEYRAIYEDLNAGVGWITTRPGFDPEELRIYVSEDCPCLEPFLNQFRGTQDASELVDGIPPTVLSFALETVEANGTFVARIIDQRSRGRVLDEAGVVIAEYDQQQPFESRVRVAPTPNGWQLTGLEYLSETSDATEQSR